MQVWGNRQADRSLHLASQLRVQIQVRIRLRHSKTKGVVVRRLHLRFHDLKSCESDFVFSTQPQATSAVRAQCPSH